MDEKEFLKRLSEVAEWHRPQTGPNGSPSISKGKEKKMPPHPGPITEAELDEMSEHEVKVYYDKLIAWRESQPNLSVPPEIIRVKCQPHMCEDCSCILEEPRRTERKVYDSGQRHWRERCVNCNNFRHPITKEFSVGPREAHQFFLQFYRPKLGKYRSKYQPNVKPKEPTVRPRREPQLTKSEIMQRIIDQGHWETRETEESITRTFVPKSPKV